MKSTRRTVVAVVLALLAALVVALPAGQPAMAAAPLTNLAHLDWLGDRVAPPAQAGHTTYRIDSEPQIDVLWTYADLRADGLYVSPAPTPPGQGCTPSCWPPSGRPSVVP
jgi:hypothetical protein